LQNSSSEGGIDGINKRNVIIVRLLNGPVFCSAVTVVLTCFLDVVARNSRNFVSRN